jgi:serine/threonine-protein kinase
LVLRDWIGQTVSKVVIQDRLGRGSMAEVYLGYHTTLERPMVVKILYAHLTEDPQLRSRFHTEARAVATLRHPNIVRVFDFDSTDGRPYIVMELIEGISLEAYLASLCEQGSTLPDEATLHILQRLAEALDYAHAEGVLHRDIKPGNVMLRNGGSRIKPGEPLPEGVQPVLTDFGLARISFAPEHTAPGTVMGTPAYMSPEQVEGGAVDERSDIYSLGVLAYEMLAGYRPFRSKSDSATSTMYMQVHSPAPPLPLERMQLQPVFDRALAKDPTQRYATASAFSAELEQGLKTPAAQPFQSKRVHKRALATAALVIPLFIGLVRGTAGDGSGGAAENPVPPATEAPLVFRQEPATQAAVKGQPASPTPTSFPTLARDPRTGLDRSQPNYEERFDPGSSWGTYDQSGAAYNINQGVLSGIDYQPEERYTWWAIDTRQSGNLYAEVTTQNGDCMGRDSVGLSIRVDPASGRGGYSFEVSCDGAWRVRRHHLDGSPRDLVDWSPSEAIITGLGAINRLGLLGFGGRLVLFVNDRQVGTVTDEEYTYSFGTFALFVRASLTFDLQASFDDFEVWHLRTVPWE